MAQYLGTANWGSAYISMYAEVRDGVMKAVAYYGKALERGGCSVMEKVFDSRAQMREWVDTSGRIVASAK